MIYNHHPDFTGTQENRRLPLSDIGLEDYTIDTLIAKWEVKAMENMFNSTRPKSVQEEAE